MRRTLRSVALSGMLAIGGMVGLGASPAQAQGFSVGFGYDPRPFGGAFPGYCGYGRPSIPSPFVEGYRYYGARPVVTGYAPHLYGGSIGRYSRPYGPVNPYPYPPRHRHHHGCGHHDD